jgi:hypothetical protein
MERRGRALYRHGAGTNRAGSNEELRREDLRCLGRIFWPEEEDDDVLPVRAHMSARGREELRTGSDFGFLGRGLFHLLGRKVPPEALLYFFPFPSFSFSVFFIPSYLFQI